jgi:DNA mismatch endonuclease, patch repair protein
MSGVPSDVPPQPKSPAALRPSYKGLRPASAQATAAARGSSKKTDTRCEVTLRRTLWAAGCRYRKNVPDLPGRPDIVFHGPKVAVFCDGDFWHGRDWETRCQKLGSGTNSAYWLAKIQRNMERDRQNTRRLQEMGWTVLHFWESQIRSDPAGVARIVREALHEKGSRSSPLLTPNIAMA